MAEEKFKPVLGLWDATMIVAGSMIGSGIFIVSADIVRNFGSGTASGDHERQPHEGVQRRIDQPVAA